jgi:hypothetical protein
LEPDGEHPISDDNRRQVIRQVTKLVSGEGVHYASPQYGWADDVIFRKDQPVTMQSDAVPNHFRALRHRRDDLHRSDIAQIIEDARDFEDTHGRDHGTDPRGNQTVSYGDVGRPKFDFHTGNGWLLNHPLRKLLFYQHYLDTKARLAPAAKAPTTPTKKAKKAKTSLVGKAVIKAFKGYKNPRDDSPYFDGVVKSVEDGKCVIVWEDGDETSMTEAAVQKILL